MALTSLTPLTSLTSQAETFGFNSLKKLLHDIGLTDKVDDFGHITESQTSNRIGTTIINSYATCLSIANVPLILRGNITPLRL